MLLNHIKVLIACIQEQLGTKKHYEFFHLKMEMKSWKKVQIKQKI
jgi:hypothetical protein